jgi:uncharacterized protein (DUF2384 family)
MSKNILILKNSLIKFLSKGNLDEKYMICNKKTYTKRMMIEELNNDTDFGNDFINSVLMLAVDLFDRKKEKLNNFEKI